MSFDWFAPTGTYRRPIVKPGSDEEIGWVELRPLNAGHIAALGEMRIVEGEGRISYGEMSFHQVHAALSAWSLGSEITVETLKRLNPLILEQIRRHVDVGEGESEEADEQSPAGNGVVPLDVLPSPASVGGGS